jgi:hypothetical protein
VQIPETRCVLPFQNIIDFPPFLKALKDVDFPEFLTVLKARAGAQSCWCLQLCRRAGA